MRVQQLHPGDREKSEPPGDWTVVMGKEKASLGTEQRLPFPFPIWVRQKHETSSNTDYQSGKSKRSQPRPRRDSKQTLHGKPQFLPFSLVPSLPGDEKGQYDRTPYFKKQVLGLRLIRPRPWIKHGAQQSLNKRNI